jgi:imidazolonepropionase-like amidohydrolase
MRVVKASLNMSFGTDAGVCRYEYSSRQFAFMVKYGMTPMQAIQSATSNAADLLGKSDILGSIKSRQIRRRNCRQRRPAGEHARD